MTFASGSRRNEQRSRPHRPSAFVEHIRAIMKFFDIILYGPSVAEMGSYFGDMKDDISRARHRPRALR